MAGNAKETTVLVTGANGFVGRHLVSLLKREWPFAQIVTTGLSHGEHCEPLDITCAGAVDTFIQRCRPDFTVHLAAQANVADSFKQADRTWQVNLNGTLNLLYALETHATGSAVIIVGSADCYGASFKSGETLDEHCLMQPLNPYAASKAAADLAAGQVAATSSLKVVRVRPFNHAGPGQSEHFVVASFARQIARIEQGLQSEIQVGDTNTFRDFLDVQDVCAAYVGILDGLRNGSLISRAPATGWIFNVCSSKALKISDVLQQLVQMSTADIRVVQDPERYRRSDIPYAVGNAAALQQAIGWHPKTAWAQTLGTTLDYWRQHIKPERHV